MAVLHSVVHLHLHLHLCGERVRSCGVRVWLRVGVGKADGYAAQSQKREERGEHRAVRSVQVSAVAEWSWRHRRCMAIRGSGSLQYQSFGQIIVRDRIGIEPNRMKCQKSEVHDGSQKSEVRRRTGAFAAVCFAPQTNVLVL